MKLYLDNCCYYRPFDDQSNMRNRLETDAKLYIQSQIRSGKHTLVWSCILEYENGFNPYEDRRLNTLKRKTLASDYCVETESKVKKAKGLQLLGIRAKDALYISCAIESGADCLITTDDKLLSKTINGVAIINPIDFVRRDTSYDI